MYFRESSMPPQEQWDSLFDIGLILDRFALAGDIAELGCGYGTFTLPLARRTSGTVHAIDIETPRGPPPEIRPTAAMVAAWAAEAGGLAVSDGPFLLPPWHHGLQLTRVIRAR